MEKTSQIIGFSYFSPPEFMIRSRIETWFPFIHQLGASIVVLESGFDRAIPEDVFLTAKDNQLEPIVHFKSELPLARQFNDLSTVLDAYARWGVQYVILGDKPNTKAAWPIAGWHYDNLVDHFLDRFIPFASYLEQLGVFPVLPPLQPGGDYWDTSFLELTLKGLQRRRLDTLLSKICLTGYGYTFSRPLSWGLGGPERWASTRPYMTPAGQQDQLGFQNFEWLQAVSQKAIGKKLPVLILDAGNTGSKEQSVPHEKQLETMQLILAACRGNEDRTIAEKEEYPSFDGSLLGCTFSMDTLQKLLGDNFSFEILQKLFYPGNVGGKSIYKNSPSEKPIRHYLLLPCHESGISDVVLNKVRPIIKHYRPTIGFKLEEALLAERVSVFPDPTLFPDEKIQRLRAAGCTVEVLPHTGIEIATYLQGNNTNAERLS